MEREIIPFTTQEDWLLLRTRDLTSTDIPALFGLSPYATPRTLWESKKNPDPTPMEISKRMKAGQKLEQAIASLIAEDQNWMIEEYKNYIRIPDLKLGSSFDCRVFGTVLEGINQAWPSELHMIFEIKNVDGRFYKSWFNSSEELEAPAHIELQVQHQLLVSGHKRAAIGVLFGGNNWQVIIREANPTVHERILALSKSFWESIEANQPPAWDFENTNDQSLIRSIYSKPVEGKAMEIDAPLGALCEKYIEAKKEISFLSGQADAIKAEILENIKDASVAAGNGYKVTANLVRKKEYTVKASESRTIRITGPKGE